MIKHKHAENSKYIIYPDIHPRVKNAFDNLSG